VSGDAVTVGTIIGALIGVISLLLRMLVASKNRQVETLEGQLRDVTAERDLFRNLILSARERERG
jgi:hypothetical protein